MNIGVTSEPHLPHVLVENGDMTLEEYDEYLHGRNDFIKATKKDSSNERKVSVTSASISCSGTETSTVTPAQS